MTSKSWLGGRSGVGDWSTSANWIGGTPVSGDSDTDKNGVITATNIRIIDQTVVLDSADAGPAVPIGLNLMGSNMGQGSYLLVEATDTDPINVELHNTWLRGNVFTESGAACFIIDAGTATTNYGWIGVAGAGGVSDIVADFGSFTNFGAIQSGVNGNFQVQFGESASQKQYVVNRGVIESDKGGTITLTSLHVGPISYGTVTNYGTIKSAGGTVSIYSDLSQSTNGLVSVSKNGILNLSGEMDGGTIQIQSGMLNFGQQPEFAAGPSSAASFKSKLDFTGTSAEVAFGNPVIREAFSAATQEIFVTGIIPGTQTFGQIADLHLGTARVYSTSEFSISGSMLLFHATTS